MCHILVHKQVHNTLGEQLAVRLCSKDYSKWVYIRLAASGLPQGSILGTVFNVLTNDLDAVKCTGSKFAVDSELGGAMNFLKVGRPVLFSVLLFLIITNDSASSFCIQTIFNLAQRSHFFDCSSSQQSFLAKMFSLAFLTHKMMEHFHTLP